MSEALGLRSEMYLVAANGQDEAGAIIYWHRRGPYRDVALPPFTQFSPLLLRAKPAEAAVHQRQSALEALLKTVVPDYARLRFFAEISDIRAAQWQAWRVTPHFTYRLSLLHDDLLSLWSSATRRTFRKNQDTFRVEERPEASASIIQCCKDSYERHGRTLPVAPSHLLSLVSLLQEEGYVRLFTATPVDASVPEGGLAVLHDGQMAHYWIAGSTPGPAMTVLLGHVLPTLRDNGLQVFDFVGANTPSIAEFKRHFGPVLTPYYHLETITRPELRLLHRLKGH